MCVCLHVRALCVCAYTWSHIRGTREGLWREMLSETKCQEEVRKKGDKEEKGQERENTNQKRSRER